MTTPDAERIAELREWVNELHKKGFSPSAIADLLAVLDEVGLDKMLIADLTQDLNEENTRAEKAETEVERLRAEPEKWSDIQDSIKRLADIFLARAKKAEADLATALQRYSVAEDELSCANSKNAELLAELERVRAENKELRLSADGEPADYALRQAEGKEK